MGYCTNFYLEVEEGDLRINEILESLNEDEFEGLFWAVDEDGDTRDETKWYDHEEDMVRLSLKFPDVVFELRGEGEENDDMWYKYFKNGKIQKCYAKITYDDYDPAKLKTLEELENE
ncbi:hypothetical protein [Priestia megaterium]|uniref:hypothetical protein n=1 Tax=Priestia megaterium TaxID=1404 RepID=UPI000BFC5A5E|nr:hypothetical protein [Priestia megaterium]PGO60572.1 hypothetical protein CN981_08465 [Priestia megaterium]